MSLWLRRTTNGETRGGRERIRGFPGPIFRRFLLTYIVVLLIPLMVGVYVHRDLVHEFEEYTRSATLSSLRQTRDSVDRYMNQVEWRVLQISQNPELRSVLNQTTVGTEVDNYALKALVDDLHALFVHTDDLTTTCYVYLRDLDLIVTPDTIYDSRFYYEKGMLQVTNKDVQRWHRQASERYHHGQFFPAMEVQLDDERVYRVVPYVQSIPMTYNRPPQGFVAYLLSEASIQRLLSHAGVPDSGCTFVLGNDGTVITGTRMPSNALMQWARALPSGEGLAHRRINGEPTIAVHVRSQMHGWTYAAAFPTSFVTDRAENVRALVWGYEIVACLVGLLLALVMARRNAGPVEAIASMLHEFAGVNRIKHGACFAQIEGSVSRLIDTSRTMEESIRRKSRFMTRLFFRRLLRGEFRDIAELSEMARHAELQFRGTRFSACVVGLALGDPADTVELADSLSVRRVRVVEAGRGAFEDSGLLYEKDNETLVAIVWSQAAGGAFHRDHVGGRVEEFVARVDDDGAGPVRIAVGAPVSTMAEVHHSYEQAVDTLNHMQQNGSTEVCWFETIRTEQTDYYYPLELEGRFMAAIRAGDRVRVERILAAVRDENFAPERGSLENLRHLLFELSGTLRKLRRQLAWDGCLPDGTFHVDSVDTAAHSFSSQARAALELCAFAEQRKKSHNGQMAGRVAAYIEANYADPQMCLAAVAREFRLSEAYVSGFFKEQHGENFSDYLERLRLSHANRLLSESFMPIREIAVRVGYGSDKAFRRAFKRVHGISPHAYREIPRRMAQSGASR